MKAMACEKLCTRRYKSSTEPAYDFLRNAIILQYSHHWVVDNLPVTVCLTSEDQKRYCSASIPLGCFGETRDLSNSLCGAFTRSKNEVYLLNHAKLKIYYHPVQDSWSWPDSIRIVGVVVEPQSIAHPKDTADCASTTPLMLPVHLDSELFVTYSYSVTYERPIERAVFLGSIRAFIRSSEDRSTVITFEKRNLLSTGPNVTVVLGMHASTCRHSADTTHGPGISTGLNVFYLTAVPTSIHWCRKNTHQQRTQQLYCEQASAKSTKGVAVFKGHFRP
ncbi:transmembrane 9 superfamily member 2 [Clonorchis sinensis]|uniref:Transmembrane 9 superfamily member n=1 Tax=Clonorchis sinensis TaxID=79923 RepID=G7YUC4_CLOSI|nr:transmembrane 9 superfamily member 2 [Clonorchis sinensis]